MVMRLATFLIFISTLTISARSYSQKVSLTLNDVPLEKVFSQIRQQTGCSFLWDEDALYGLAPVNVSVHKVDLSDALKASIKGLPLGYEVHGKMVFIKRVFSQTMPSQENLEQSLALPNELRGTITDSITGEALAGVTIQVKGEMSGTTTDSKGSFKLDISPNAVLIVSYLGYKTIEVPVNHRASVHIKLSSSATGLNQLVVVGYGTQQQKDITGSIASLNADQISKQPVTNAAEVLQGQVPGVQVVPDSYKPGAGMSIRVRGTRSITASNEPLYVIDGVPLNGDIDDINPNDIASIQVLRDASATAIYGSRGANGVILINTKQGQVGKIQVSYNGYVSSQKQLRKVKMLSGRQFADYKREAYKAVGQYVDDEHTFVPAELAGITNGTSTDWNSLIMRTGLQESHQLQLSGGTDHIRFMLSPSYLYQKGITKGQDFKRYSLTSSITVRVNDKFKVGLSSIITNSVQNLGYDGIYYTTAIENPLVSPYDSLGALVFSPVNDDQLTNPLSTLANYIDENRRTRIFGSIYAEYEFIPGLTYRINFGPDLTFNRNGVFQGAETHSRLGGSSYAEYNTSQQFHYTFDNIVTYKKKFKDIHAIDLTLLYSVENDRSEASSEAADQLPYDYQLFYNLGSAGEILNIASNLSEWGLQSYMGRLNYSLKDKYLLTLTGREDGSSRLAAGHKYEFFPSAAIGWIVSSESFMKSIEPVVSNLKLRVSYGTTGNTAISPYQTQGSLSRTEYVFGETTAYGYRPNTLPNSELQWEKTHQLDLGLDLTMFNNRITANLDFYRSNTDHLLLNRLLPSDIGYTNITANIGKTRNVGFDIGLNTVNIETNDFKWTTSLNFSTNKNKILRLYGNGQNDVANGWFIGSPIDVYYNYQFGGIWQTNQKDEASTYSEQPGMIKVVDQNNDGKINDADRVILGSPFPKWTGGITNDFFYKNFDLSVFLTTTQGNMIKDDAFGLVTKLFTNAGRFNIMDVPYWTPTNPNNKWPRPNINQTEPLYSAALQYYDGSFVRIRNVTLGYKLPQTVVNRIGISSARIYVQCQNAYVFTSYYGYDPESATGAAAPSPRTLVLGLNVNF